jgi:hypothetical protein
MNIKSKQFIIFSSAIIILLLILLFTRQIHSYILGNNDIVRNNDIDITGYKPVEVRKLDPTTGKELPYEQDQQQNTGQAQGQNQGQIQVVGGANNNKINNSSNSSNPSNLFRENPRSSTNTISSRDQNNIVRFGSDFLNNTYNSILTPVSSIVSSGTLNNTLPISSYLGKVRVINDISIGDSTATLDSARVPLNTGMQLVIDNDNYNITNVTMVSNWFTSALRVTLDKGSRIFVARDTYLTVLTPATSTKSPVTTFNANNSIYSMLTAEPASIFSGKPVSTLHKTYILHLSRATNTNGKLIFKESVNVTNDVLKRISENVVTTFEPFGIMNREGFSTGSRRIFSDTNDRVIITYTITGSSKIARLTYSISGHSTSINAGFRGNAVTDNFTLLFNNNVIQNGELIDNLKSSTNYSFIIIVII